MKNKQILKTNYLLLISLLLLSHHAFGMQSSDLPGSNKNVWVFMMAGQSNMAGRAKIEATDTITNPRILSLNVDGELITAKEPLHFYEPDKASLDCGVAFARELLKIVPDSISILMVPTAVGGSSIVRWLDDKPHRGINLLSNFKKRMKQACRYGELKAVLWHQGESDANLRGVRSRYKNMTELFKRFREFAKNDSLPILVGELGTYSRNPQIWKEMNEEIHRYVFSDPYCRIISTSDLKDRGDRLHFNSAGQRAIGYRFAKKYQEEFMLRQQPKDHLKTVVMTFDDAEIGQYSIASFLLRKFGFGGTFMVCEYPRHSPEEITQYMSWAEIKQLNDFGFEIGNHTGHHKNVTKLNRDELTREIAYVEDKCKEYNIPKPISFAYPGNRSDSAAVAVLTDMGYKYGRVGGSRLYRLENENNLIIPSYTAGSTKKLKPRIIKALNNLQQGQVIVLLFHGIPDLLNPDYSTSVPFFKQIIDFMHSHHFNVIAMRDLDSL